MSTPENKKDTLKLKPIGTDSWSRPVYEDQNGHLWKDITLGRNKPNLCSALNNAFDGEPGKRATILQAGNSKHGTG